MRSFDSSKVPLPLLETNARTCPRDSGLPGRPFAMVYIDLRIETAPRNPVDRPSRCAKFPQYRTMTSIGRVCAPWLGDVRTWPYVSTIAARRAWPMLRRPTAFCSIRGVASFLREVSPPWRSYRRRASQRRSPALATGRHLVIYTGQNPNATSYQMGKRAECSHPGSQRAAPGRLRQGARIVPTSWV